jgi:hypothetical protein
MAFLSSRTTIIVLTLITAGYHLFLGLFPLGEPLEWMFVLNGIGYFTLLFLTFWPPAALKGQAGLIRWAFIGYTIVTIIAYFLAWRGDAFNQIDGVIIKAVELLLVLGLWQSRGK